ncbi:MAG: Gfo/Idh/MocA family protein [Phycisphaerales bacterium]
MSDQIDRTASGGVTRREFVAAGTAAGLVAAAAVPALPAFAQDAAKADAAPKGPPRKVALVGCGGRGTGAADQALRADPGVILWAVADVFPDRMDACLKQFEGHPMKDRVQVPAARRFAGFDGYKAAIDSGVDVVLLCSAPHFRPMHLAAAVDAKKHVFCEKPMFVDAPGYRSVVDSVRKAREAKRNLVSGFCWRRSSPERATFAELEKGTLGTPMAMYSCYYTGPLGTNARKPGWSDMEFQVRNWQHFNWLSGDIIVEQAVHSIDKINWCFRNEPPAKAVGMGGRQLREAIPERGDVYDHFAIVYEWADGRRAFLNCRQQPDCYFENTDWITGTKGQCFINGWGPTHWMKDPDGKVLWRYPANGPKPNMYQVEHDELFRAIRAGEVIDDGDWMVVSNMMAVLGRMAAYSGQQVTWAQAIASTESLSPPAYEMGALPMPTEKKPGQYKVTVPDAMPGA